MRCLPSLPSLSMRRAPVWQSAASPPQPPRPVARRILRAACTHARALPQPCASLSCALARSICFLGNAPQEEVVVNGWTDRAFWAADGIHPNSRGYRVWAEHIGKGILRQAVLGGTFEHAAATDVRVGGP